MERIYRRNVVSQQLSFKWQSLVHVRSLPAPGKASKIALLSLATCVYLLDTLVGVAAVDTLVWACPKAWLEKTLTSYILTSLHWTGGLLEWTTDAPAGLKLNVPLATFISDKLIAILHLWEFFYISFIQLYLTHILSFLLSLRWLGISVLLAVLYDFLKFLNLCLICFYIFTSRLFLLQLSALRSLARLFMGRKWNPLRHRVDSCDYDISQLLLGTLVFTILLFLLPTSGLYYALFFLLRLAQFTLQSLIRLIIVIINKLVVNLLTRLETAFATPSIMTLQFEITDCADNKKIVMGIWNGRKLTLNEIQELTTSKNEETKQNELLTHTMLKILDIGPF